MDKNNFLGIIKNNLKLYKIPGYSFAIIQNYKLQCIHNFGFKSSDLPTLIDNNTLFQFGSISKPITAFATLRLVQMKKLNLDKDIHTYLHSWHIPHILNFVPKITLRQLLSHTAGITISGFNGYSHDAKLPSLIDILKNNSLSYSGKITLQDIPGVTFNYSGGGYCILQQLLEDITKKPFSILMNDLVFKPLNMNNSIFCTSIPSKSIQLNASGHYFDGIPLKNKYMLYPELAAAGIWSTTQDISKFLIEVEKCFKKSHNSLLNEDLTKAYLTPQLNSSMGLGLFIHNVKSNFHFSHGGTTHGFQSSIIGYPKEGFGIVQVSNSNNCKDLFSFTINTLSKNYLDKSILTSSKKNNKFHKYNFSIYSGRYKLENNVFCLIYTIKNKLFLKFESQQPIQLINITNYEFSTDKFNYHIIFEFKKNKVDTFIIKKRQLTIRGFKLS